MTPVQEAVILMAGQGSRLRGADTTFLKPFVLVDGRRLISYAVDRKLDSIFDLNDAMKVQTRKNTIINIGKDLRDYDAIDIGLFVCPVEIFDYLERAKSGSDKNDCSLSDGIRLMARDNKVRAIDIGESWWQDVDTPEMLQRTESQI